MPDDNSVDQFGHVWTEATRPGEEDRPSGATHDRIINWQIGQTSGWEKLMQGPYHMMMGADLYWSLTFTLWRYTPLLSSGAPGKPLKILHCKMDPNTILHAPVVQPTPQQEGSPYPGPPPASACMAGAFVESINVRMGFEDPRALLTDPGMDTDAQHGSVSTSTSYQFSGGFFGMTGTGSASATFTHSASVSLTDFEVTSKSTTTQTNNTVAIEMWSDGNRYTDGPPTPGTPPPDRAMSDTRLAMQGIWELDGDIADDLAFDVAIDVTYAVGGDYSNGWKVRAEQYGIPESPWITTYRETVSWVRKVTVPLSVVDK